MNVKCGRIARRRVMVLALAAGVPMALPSGARADKTWKPSVTSGNWSTAGNWVEGSAPTGSDNVIIAYGATPITATYDAASFSSNLALNILGGNAASDVTLVMPAGSETLQVGFSNVGQAGYGSMTQNGGTFTLNSYLDVGDQTESHGAYTLNSGTVNVTGTGGGLIGEFIGYNGNGTFNQSAGTNTAGVPLFLGYNGGSSGIYSLSGTGSLTVNSDENVGNVGSGMFVQSGGAHTIGNATLTRMLRIGASAGSTGTYSLSGTGSLTVNGSEIVGVIGFGTFVQSGGTHTVANVNSLFLGSDSVSSGTYSLSGNGVLTVTGHEVVGLTGKGTFVQTGGTHTVGTSSTGLYLGDSNTASGVYSLSGTGVLSVIGNEYEGYLGGGTFVQSGGTHTVSAGASNVHLFLGYYAGSTGTYTLSNTGILHAHAAVVGEDGSGTFTQSGGTHTVDFSLAIGDNAGSSGTYGLSNIGNLTVNAGVFVGYSGSGTFTQSGGTLNATNASSFIEIGENAGSNGSYALSGGNVSTGNFAVGIHGTAAYTQTGGTANFTGSVGFRVGVLTGSSGTATLSGGSLTADTVHIGGSTSAGAGGTGVLNIQSGASMTVTDTMTIWNSGAAVPDGTRVNLSGGMLSVSALDTLPQRFNWTGGTFANTGSGGLTVAPGAPIGSSLILGAGKGLIVTGGSLRIGTSLGTGSVQISGGTETIGAPAAPQNMYLGYDSGSAGLSTLSDGGALTVNGGVFVGNSGSGTFSQTGGTHSFSGQLTLGSQTGASGVYALSNGRLVGTNGLAVIGDSGTGTFDQSGGTANFTQALQLGKSAAGTGTLLLSGGSMGVGLSIGAALIGVDGHGNVSHTAGFFNAPGGMDLGVNPGSVGIYTLSGTGSLFPTAVSVADAGTGSFIQSGGTSTMGALYLGYFGAGNGSYSLSGTGSLTVNAVNAGVYVGGNLNTAGGTGVLNISGGTTTVSGKLKVWDTGAAAPGGTRVNMTGGIVTANAIEILNGDRLNLSGGVLNITGPSNSSVTGTLTIGSGGNATLNLSGGTLNVSGQEYVGGNGVGQVNQTGGNHTIQSGGLGTLYVGYAGGGGSYSISGGNLTADSILVGYPTSNVSGTFTQSGGNVSGAALLVGGYSGTGIYNLSGGTLTSSVGIGAQSPSNTGSGTFTQSGGTAQLTAVTIASGPSTTAAYNLNNSVAILNDSGDLTVGGAASAGGTGTLNISAGSATIGGKLKVWNSGGSAVNFSGGSLSVVGSIDTDLHPERFNWTGGALNLTKALEVNSAGPLGASVSLTSGKSLSVSAEFIAGTVTQSAGSTNTDNGLTWLGPAVGTSGTYNLLGGTFNSCNTGGGALVVGESGTGTFYHSGGILNVGSAIAPTTDIELGEQAGAVGIYTLSGTATLNNYGSEIIAGSATGAGAQPGGQFDQTGGTHIIGMATANRDLIIANHAGSTGVFSLSASTGPGVLIVNGSASVGGSTTAGGTGTLNVAGGAMAVTGTLKIWDTPGTQLNLSGGSLSVGSIDTTASPPGFNWTGGALNITGTGGFTVSPAGPLGSSLLVDTGKTLSVTNTLTISSSSTLTNSGGTVVAGTLVNNGTYKQPGSTALFGSISGSGALDIGGGIFTVSDPGNSSYAGVLNNSAALVVQAGTTRLSGGGTHTGSFSVASGATLEFGGGTHNLNSGYNISGLGTVRISAGTVNVGSFVTGGRITDITGGTLAVADLEAVGQGAAGTVTQSAGSNMVGNQMYVGYTAPGSYVLNGGLLDVSGGAIEAVGYFANGTFTQNGGVNQIVNTVNGAGSLAIQVGVSSGVTGTYQLHGGSLTAGNYVILGYAGSGLLNQDGGSVSTNTLYVGFGNGGTGSGNYALSGTGSVAAATEYIGYNGVGTFTQTGGTHTVTGTLSIATGGAASSYTLSGGLLSASTVTVNSNGVFHHNSGSLNLQTLKLLGGGKMDVAARASSGGNNRPLRTNTLSIDSAGALDLNDNDLVVNNGVFSDVQALVFNGYSSTPDTTKTGIISTVGQNTGGVAILALFNNALFGVSDYPFGSGQTIGANAIVGKYTYIGDTDWNGQVDPQDYTAIDANLGATGLDLGAAWFSGDTNFDGNIDPSDYTGVDAALGLGQGNPLSVAGSPAVPEPGIGVFAAGSILLLRRRRPTISREEGS